LRQIHPAEHDAGIGRRRAQGDFDALAAVQAHANGVSQRFEGSLLQHGLILPRHPCFRLA
jgi:hypothetical protein